METALWSAIGILIGVGIALSIDLAKTKAEVVRLRNAIEISDRLQTHNWTQQVQINASVASLLTRKGDAVLWQDPQGRVRRGCE